MQPFTFSLVSPHLLGFNFLSKPIQRVKIRHSFSELQFPAACGALTLLSEGGTMLGLGACVRSAFPRRAASSVHVRLHVVQHVSQRVFDHSSPAHVAHLRGGNNKKTDQTKARGGVGVFVRSEVFTEALTGWYLRSFGGCLNCGPKLTDT